MSNDDVLEGELKQLKGWIKEQWGRLTDDDLVEFDGKVETLAGKVQERYGVEREKALGDVRDWNRRNVVGR